MMDADCIPNGVIGVFMYSIGDGGGAVELRSSSAHSLENPTSTAGPRIASVMLLSPTCCKMPRSAAHRRNWKGVQSIVTKKSGERL